MPETRERKVFVTLTGGLGNQLFQLAAGLNLAQGGKVICECTDGNPRLSMDIQTQIQCFDLPSNVYFRKKQKKSWIYSKLFGYSLRSGYSPKKFESTEIFKLLIKYLNGFGAVLRSGHYRDYLIGTNVGFSEFMLKHARSHLVGYFQSYKWMEDVHTKNVMLGISVPDFTAKSEYKTLADVEHPTLIHVRLTDYISESSFGLLSVRYYKQAIEKLEASGALKPEDKFWVFSDDISGAKNLLSFIGSERIRWIIDQENCPASTLEIMRLCQNYIISNSTFSWWGAALSHNENAKVLYPEPWFKSAPTPNQLTTQPWIPIKSEWR
jgi:hypothetical protein